MVGAVFRSANDIPMGGLIGGMSGKFVSGLCRDLRRGCFAIRVFSE